VKNRRPERPPNALERTALTYGTPLIGAKVSPVGDKNGPGIVEGLAESHGSHLHREVRPTGLNRPRVKNNVTPRDVIFLRGTW